MTNSTNTPDSSADQTPAAPEWRTLKGIACPFQLYGTELEDGTFSRAKDRKQVTGAPITIVHQWVSGSVRYGATADGREVCLWGVATKHWITPGAAPVAEQVPAGTCDTGRRVVEGVIVTHNGTAQGSAPKDATHPDVVAARQDLDGLAVATLTDHHDVGERGGDEGDVRGYVIQPRGQGRVAVYWLEGGQSIRRDELPYGPALDCLAERLESRGWTTEKMLRSSRCVFAHRPAETVEAPAELPAAELSAAEVEAARFVVDRRGSGYAVRDTVTGRDVEGMTSRYAAISAAKRRNEEAARSAPGGCSCPRGESSIYKAHHRTVCVPASQPQDITAVPLSAGLSGSGCVTHGIPDQRGPHADVLPVPACEGGVTYGVWDDFAGGFTYVEDCAMDVGNWAAREVDRIVGGMTVMAVCRDHEEQPANGCEDCVADESDDQEDEEQPPAIGAPADQAEPAAVPDAAHGSGRDRRAPLSADEATRCVSGTWPNATDFQPHQREGGHFAGYTFRAGHLHSARYGWITAAGTYAKGLESYRSTAANVLLFADQDDRDAREDAQRSAIARSMTGRKLAANRCVHGLYAREDVAGDPVMACAMKAADATFGVFTGDGVTDTMGCAVKAANLSAHLNTEDAAARSLPEDAEPYYLWAQICREHPEQVAGRCETCGQDTPDEDQDDDSQSDVLPAADRARIITYRGVPVPSQIGEQWDAPSAGNWRDGVDAALTLAALTPRPAV